MFFTHDLTAEALGVILSSASVKSPLFKGQICNLTLGLNGIFPQCWGHKCNFSRADLKFLKLELGSKIDLRKMGGKVEILESHLKWPTGRYQVATQKLLSLFLSFSSSLFFPDQPLGPSSPSPMNSRAPPPSINA